MERRLFLTGLLGVAGAAAVASVVRPAQALAGVPDMSGGPGILDELDMPANDGEEAIVEPVYHRDWHRPGHPHWRYRRRRRRVWRRVCRRYWHHGRWRHRCRRVRVWVYW
ncbi:protamine-2 (modular protein) [Mesorhizobium denitrificans]|uniref:Protamine-2 (Modular protein) n=1 Tax=Mesorhizobium denitrificans TaxID=2294114 RepID=A0A371X973_9HYPH|nr:protamine-2 (modular protein) [Mesorhizobium denitrificans]